MCIGRHFTPLQEKRERSKTAGRRILTREQEREGGMAGTVAKTKKKEKKNVGRKGEVLCLKGERKKRANDRKGGSLMSRQGRETGNHKIKRKVVVKEGDALLLREKRKKAREEKGSLQARTRQ